VPCRRWSRDSLAPSPPRHRHDTAVDTPGGGVSQVALQAPGSAPPLWTVTAILDVAVALLRVTLFHWMY
jgi:hypothetical protein